MSEAVIGFGSNLGEKNANLLRALQAVSRLPGVQVTGISSIYESSPVEAPGAQEDYHNMCVKVDVSMSPMALLGACLGIEAALGRVRAARNAARVIDLDLLLYEGVKSESFELSLPHPRLLQRAFVLLPLKELYPSGRAPGIFFEPYIKEVDGSGVRKLEQRIAME
ncbi:MAG: 2-amino-4-hydroxy-6-hydroxymethyldihydropteridine diphosphokinase [Oscillospiraceae bacterium]|jgi:2-amino-4-hydroxy-6-hydroxymethyldihydropteridine diphosphokinase|nr:2-amino-4-hydroxy-6-hydroxymethyldihydropteridine diphosphokinase [Oscillospiraceae bacterium]